MLEQIRPMDIERRSFEIITELLGDRKLDPENELVIKRAIHTTADFDYADNLVFSDHAVTKGIEALRAGCDIVTDTQMAKAGINKTILASLGGEVHCFMSDPDVAAEAKARGVTRAIVSMERAAQLPKPCIFAIGNAPTALFCLESLMQEGALLQCTSYDSGSFEARVLNVSDYPVDSFNNFSYGGDSNPNVSYYTFNAEITDQSLQFTDQNYVTITLQSNKLAKGSLVVMKAFIRTEHGNSYVYKDNNGTLKKQQVTVGSIVNSGYYAVVTSGLKSDDLLAFPYGDTVQEGARTKEVSLDDMYNE